MSDSIENQFWGRSQKNGGRLAPSSLIEKKLKDQSRAVLSFPDDIGTHKFLMLFQQYNFDQGATELDKGIQLPMPQSILDKYGMEYNSTDLKTTGAGIGSAISTGVANISNGGKDATMTITDDTDFQKAAGAFLSSAESIVRELNPFEQVRGASDLALGNIINPHTALLFSAVKLKEFEFAWKLYPRTAGESKNLRSIINNIKAMSHPKFRAIGDEEGSVNNFKLDYPHEVDLFYMGAAQEMHKFKRCAITSLQVNYTPEGGPAFIAGSGEPAFVELQIGFTETMIWTAEDFDVGASHMGVAEEELDIKPDNGKGQYGGTR